MQPFVIFSLPRSRSAWLSRFLSYGDWDCGHEQLRYMRSLDDVKSWLGLPNTGSCETAAAPFWRLLPKDIKVVTIRRPVSNVLESLAAQGVSGPEIIRQINYLDRKLDQVERRVPSVLSVPYDELRQIDMCALLFEHCLPYRFDEIWWHAWQARNIQINLPSLIRYVKGHLPALNRLAAQARQAMLRDMAVKPVDMPSMIIREETFEVFQRDCEPLFRQHCVEVGEEPDNWLKKNIPLMQRVYDAGAMQIMVGRSNGRPFGYLMTLVCPSLETRDTTMGQHAAFYASPEVPGLGLKLQRAALAALKEKGVSEAFMRAGIRGDGDRMDILYKRLGGQDFGRMFRVGLAA